MKKPEKWMYPAILQADYEIDMAAWREYQLRKQAKEKEQRRKIRDDTHDNETSWNQ